MLVVKTRHTNSVRPMPSHAPSVLADEPEKYTDKVRVAVGAEVRNVRSEVRNVTSESDEPKERIVLLEAVEADDSVSERKTIGVEVVWL